MSIDERCRPAVGRVGGAVQHLDTSTTHHEEPQGIGSGELALLI